MMRSLLTLMVVLTAALSPCAVQAAVVFSQTFEGFTDGNGCVQILAADPLIIDCRANTATNSLTIVTSIPSYGGSFPSGSKVMRGFVDSTSAQGDVGLMIGDGALGAYDNYIPADVWFQVALYINNTGAETSSVTTRPMKLYYPCANAYPCNTNYFLLETGRGTSYNPFCDTTLSAQTDGDMYLVMRDSSTAVGQGTISYPTGCSSTTDHLGQTNLSEWIKPGRWNIIKCHMQSGDTASAKIDCWLGEMGSALTHVMSWHGGTAVEGGAFTWTVPTARGHRTAWTPSTQPANNATGGMHYFYYDDYYLATSESDLPTYATTAPRRFAPALNLRIAWVEP